MLYRGVLDALSEYISSASKLNADLCIADTDFFDFLIKVLHFDLLRTESQRRGVTLVSTSLSEPLILPNWQEERERYFRYFSEPTSRRMAEIIYRNMRYNPRPARSITSLLLNPSSREWVFGASERSWLASEIASTTLNNYLLRDWTNLFQIPIHRRELSPRSTLLNTIEQDITGPLFDLIRRHLKDLEISLEFRPVEAAYTFRLATLRKVYQRVLDSRALPRTILATGENDRRRKIFLLAFQQAGVPVRGVVHGDPIYGVYKQPYTTAFSMGHLEEYYVPSQTAAELNNRNYGSHSSGRLGVSHLPVETTYFTTTKPPFGQESSPHEANHQPSVMLVGYPMNLIRYYDDESLFFFHRLQLEIRILQALRQLGYTTIYRPHPDRLAFIHKFMDGLVDSISGGPFVDAIEKADALIFTYPTTSTFGHTLMTQKQMILLDPGLEDYWDPFGKSLLQRRCHFLNLRYDAFDLPEINTSELDNILRDRSESIKKRKDSSFVDYYWRDLQV